MLQREHQVVTAHGEDAPVAVWQGADAACEMGGIIGYAHIVNHIHTRYDGHLRLEQEL